VPLYYPSWDKVDKHSMTQCCTVYETCNSTLNKSVYHIQNVTCKMYKTLTLQTTAMHPVKSELTDDYLQDTITFHLVSASVSATDLRYNTNITKYTLQYFSSMYTSTTCLWGFDWPKTTYWADENKIPVNKCTNCVALWQWYMYKFMTTCLHSHGPFKHKLKM
jgi:hypothetical protein